MTKIKISLLITSLNVLCSASTNWKYVSTAINVYMPNFKTLNRLSIAFNNESTPLIILYYQYILHMKSKCVGEGSYLG